MVLRFGKFKLSDKEGGEVELSSADTRTSRESCERSLVGRIFGGKGINYTGLKQTMTKLWCTVGSLKVVELKNKRYQFFFSNEDERRRVLEKRPWTFDNQLLVIHPWKHDIEHDETLFNTSPMWVQAWEIPPQWLTSATVWKIGRVFSQVLNVIIPETGSKDGRLAKMLVEVDLSKPLIRGTSIKYEGDKRWILFKYELLPLFCFYCGHVGHAERLCECKTHDAKNGTLNEGQFGDWLRAGSGRTSIRGQSVATLVPGQLTTNSQGADGKQGKLLNTEGRSVAGDSEGKAGVNDSGRQKVARDGHNEGGTSALSETKGEWGKTQANKENESGVSNISTDIPGGRVETEARGDVRAVVKGGESSRVLQELDQNSSMVEDKISDNHTRGGTWRRRTGAANHNGSREGDLDQVNAGKRCVNSGKRGFFLIDEEEALDETTQIGKRQKLDRASMIICQDLVEEASHEWPHMDQ